MPCSRQLQLLELCRRRTSTSALRCLRFNNMRPCCTRLWALSQLACTCCSTSVQAAATSSQPRRRRRQLPVPVIVLPLLVLLLALRARELMAHRTLLKQTLALQCWQLHIMCFRPAQSVACGQALLVQAAPLQGQSFVLLPVPAASLGQLAAR